MPAVVMWGLGLFLFSVACVWLVIIPFRMSKGLMHKWGYHAHCGVNCEQFMQGRVLQAKLNDGFSSGLRQGMRWTVQAGIEDTAKMLREHNLLPEIAPDQFSDDSNKRVGAMLNKLSRLTDVSDDPEEWEDALALALWTLIRRRDDPAEGVRKATYMLERLLSDAGLSDVAYDDDERGAGGDEPPPKT